MNEDFIADIWSLFGDQIPEKLRKEAANDFINILLDHGIKDSTLENLLSIDPYLDDAINYVIDTDGLGQDEDSYYEEDE